MIYSLKRFSRDLNNMFFHLDIENTNHNYNNIKNNKENDIKINKNNNNI